MILSGTVRSGTGIYGTVYNYGLIMVINRITLNVLLEPQLPDGLDLIGKMPSIHNYLPEAVETQSAA